MQRSHTPHNTIDHTHAKVFVGALGCKHSKVDQTSDLVYESGGFLSQTPISSSKMLFRIEYFS